MIPFACPSCRCPHIASRDFGGMHTKCFQCGALLHIPAADPAGAGRPRPVLAAATAGAATATGGARTQGHSRLGTQVAPALTIAAPRRAAAPAAAERPTPVPGTAPHTPAEESPPTAPDAKTPTAPDAKKPATKKATRADDRKRRRVVVSVAAGVGAVALIAAVYAFGFTDSPKEPPTKSPDVVRNNQEPGPPPQPGDKTGGKKDATQPSTTPPGNSTQPPPPVTPPQTPATLQPEAEFTAARLLAEWAEDPPVFDRRYAGKPVVVRGTVARTIEGEVILSDSGSGDSLHGELKLGPSGQPLRPAQPLRPSQPVTLRGKYLPGPRLADCEVVKSGSPADDTYKGKEVVLAGIVAQVSGNTVTLEAPTTDCPVTVPCVFAPAKPADLTGLRPGEPILLRGRCAGRTFRTVRIDNCSLVRPTDAPNPAAVAVRADKFFTDYEADLLAADRPKPGTASVAVTPDALAAAFQTDPRAAAATYRSRVVTLTGKVITRDPAARTVVFESGMSQRYLVVAAFTPTQYRAVRPDEPTLTLRGTCDGLGNRGFIRIENAEVFDPDAGNPAVRIVADYLPFPPGRELFYDRLTPEAAKNNPIQRWVVRFTKPDQVQSTMIRAGTFPGPTLFATPPQTPRWGKEALKAQPPQVSRYRKGEEFVEIALAPAPGEPLWWDPVLKIGARKGQSWSAELPDGRTVEYTVVNFGKDDTGKQLVEVGRVLRDPKQPERWEESTVAYVLAVGEVRRVTLARTPRGQSAVLSEMKLVPPELPGTEPQ